jgi:nitrite reductase/ring-hydroxylating ferredoxin subunit
MLVRRGREAFAIGAACSHYGGPLAEGLVVGETVRCPWHHACFSLRTGEALRAPALKPVDVYEVAIEEGKAVVRGKGKRPGTVRPRVRAGATPHSVGIVGAGAAGNCVAEELRHLGYQGDITLVDADGDAPYDRPNLSKDYLAGTAPEDWTALHPARITKTRRSSWPWAGAWPRSTPRAGRSRSKTGRDASSARSSWPRAPSPCA